MTGDLNWYHAQSEPNAGETLHCPFADADRCPRYFESLDLVDQVGGCSIDIKLKKRFKRHWGKTLPMFPLPEQSPSVMRSNDRLLMLNNFCPEVTSTIHGWYASDLYAYSDEVDIDLAHARLGKLGADASDPRWQWSTMRPLHYVQCPAYSILKAKLGNTEKTTDIVGLKPSVWGFSVDLRALWRWLITSVRR